MSLETANQPRKAEVFNYQQPSSSIKDISEVEMSMTEMPSILNEPKTNLIKGSTNHKNMALVKVGHQKQISVIRKQHFFSRNTFNTETTNDFKSS